MKNIDTNTYNLGGFDLNFTAKQTGYIPDCLVRKVLCLDSRGIVAAIHDIKVRHGINIDEVAARELFVRAVRTHELNIFSKMLSPVITIVVSAILLYQQMESMVKSEHKGASPFSILSLLAVFLAACVLSRLLSYCIKVSYEVFADLAIKYKWFNPYSI